METGQSDNELIREILAGGHQAYKVLVDRYQHYIFTLAMRLTNSREDAEEIAQDVFVKAFKSLADFKFGSKFSTWLYTIAHNTGITHLRKKKLQTQSLDNESTFFQAENQESDFRANQVEDKHRRQMVNKAIGMLSADDAQVITLFYKGEQTLEEMGQILGLEPNAVKVRLFRARQRLKEKMEKFFAEDVKSLTIL